MFSLSKIAEQPAWAGQVHSDINHFLHIISCFVRFCQENSCAKFPSVDFSPRFILMAALDWSQCPAVESIPGKVSGPWVFRGTRMPVATVFREPGSGRHHR